MEKEFIRLINQHPGILYKVCNLYLQEAEDKRDLFQEIVLQLWKAFPNFRQEAQPSTWMYRVALNTAISNFRKKSKGFFATSLSEAELQIPDPQQFSLGDDNIGILHRAIAQLSPVEKAIILLYLEEKTYGEMAEVIGITKSNVGVSLSRIKTKLEKILKSLPYEFR
ncbi:RNA polymerase sigma factor [soil metagenome]